MKNCCPCCILLCFLFAAPSLSAEDTGPPPVLPLKMDTALMAARPSPGSVTLAVDAAKVSLPTGTVLPGDPLTGQEVGALYGQKTQPFGTVMAVAPTSITVVYVPSAAPSAYADMPPGQVMKLLAQTFTPSQWKGFMSSAGVGYTEMQDTAQQTLFQALFPGGHLSLIEDNPTGDNDPKTKREFSGDALTAARLRLACLSALALQMTGTPDGHVFGQGLRPAGSPPRYFMTNSQSSEVDRELGAQVRETVPNMPKPGQLAFDDPALKIAVPLADIKTVGDLVVRISRATHREIYADPRYAARSVTLSPASQQAAAGDLLPALALCVGGTFRRVGPAFVLTDDLVGLGTKHVLWKAFEDKGQEMLPGGNSFFPTPANPNVPYTVRDISDSDDPLAFTPKQRESYWKKWGASPGQSSMVVMDVTVPFDQLSPAQQEAAGMMQEAGEKRRLHTTLSGTVMVQEEPEVEVMLPDLNGPVIISQSYQSLLPYPTLSPAEQQVQQKRAEIEFPQIAQPSGPSPDFAKTLRGFARRAALIAPKTPKETTHALAALSALGFTEAWLQIRPGSESTDAEARARLVQAVAAGRKAGIRVLPDISLLHWQDGIDPALLDCDIEGKTVLAPQVSQFSPAVSPFSLAAAERLTALIRALGSVPGIGGMVWTETLSPGYETAVQGVNFRNYGATLGYSEAGRLAFLRVDHADPVDLCDNSYSNERAHVHVPGFDSDFNLERRLFTDWEQERAAASQALARQLAAALPASFNGIGPHLPLFLPPANISFASSLGSWDDLHGRLPTVQFIAPTAPDGQILMGMPGTERMSSSLAYIQISAFAPPSASVQTFQSAAARGMVRSAAHGYRNIFLDMTNQIP